MLVRDTRVLRRHRQVDVGGVAGGVPPAADGELVAGERALLLGRVRGQVQARGLGSGALHHRHEVVAVRADGRRPGGRPLGCLGLLREAAGAGGRLGRAGLGVAVAATLTAGATRAAGAAGAGGRGRGDHPVVVTAAAEGRTALGRPLGLLRESGRGRRGGLLVALRSATGRAGRTGSRRRALPRGGGTESGRAAGAAGATRTAWPGRTTRTTGPGRTTETAGAARATGTGRTTVSTGTARSGRTTRPPGTTRPGRTTETAGATGPTRTTGPGRTTRTTRPGRTTETAGAARATRTGRTTVPTGTARARPAGGVAERRDRLGRAVHLRRAGTLVLERVTAAVGGTRRAGRTGPARWLEAPARAGRRRRRSGGRVRGRRVRQEVPPALLAERGGALPRRTALRAELRLGVRHGGQVRRAPTGLATGAARAAGRAAWATGSAGWREAVAAAGRGRRWRRRHGTRHAVTADLAPVVGTRLVSVRAGRHVGASLLRSLLGHFFTRTVLVDRVSSVISSASSTFAFSRTVPVAASTTSTTFASSFAVSAFPEALAS